MEKELNEKKNDLITRAEDVLNKAKEEKVTQKEICLNITFIQG